MALVSIKCVIEVGGGDVTSQFSFMGVKSTVIFLLTVRALPAVRVSKALIRNSLAMFKRNAPRL